jgi:hypothetical protein
MKTPISHFAKQAKLENASKSIYSSAAETAGKPLLARETSLPLLKPQLHFPNIKQINLRLATRFPHDNKQPAPLKFPLIKARFYKSPSPT